MGHQYLSEKCRFCSEKGKKKRIHEQNDNALLTFNVDVIHICVNIGSHRLETERVKKP